MGYYVTTSDPADSWSNHWSNADKGICPECGSENIEHSHIDKYSFTEYYQCEDCEEIFKID